MTESTETIEESVVPPKLGFRKDGDSLHYAKSKDHDELHKKTVQHFLNKGYKYQDIPKDGKLRYPTTRLRHPDTKHRVDIENDDYSKEVRIRHVKPRAKKIEESIEEVEQLAELSKATLINYSHHALDSARYNDIKADKALDAGDEKTAKKLSKKVTNRENGFNKARHKIIKDSVELELDEQSVYAHLKGYKPEHTMAKVRDQARRMGLKQIGGFTWGKDGDKVTHKVIIGSKGDRFRLISNKTGMHIPIRENVEELDEKSPPSPRIEAWIKANKARFKAQYGDEKGEKVLYGKAWNMYKEEMEFEEVDELSSKKLGQYTKKAFKKSGEDYKAGNFSSALKHREGVRTAVKKMMKEESGLEEELMVGQKVRLTNPKASPRHTVLALSKSHVTVMNANGNRKMKFKRDRIEKVMSGKKLNEDFKVGDKVHLGLAVKGGAGFPGTIKKIDGETVHIEGFGKNKFGSKTYKGHVSKLSKLGESVEKPTLFSKINMLRKTFGE
jgi:hypothetical protein